MLGVEEHVPAETARMIQSAIDRVDHRKVVRTTPGGLEHLGPPALTGIIVNRQQGPLRPVEGDDSHRGTGREEQQGRHRPSKRRSDETSS